MAEKKKKESESKGSTFELADEAEQAKENAGELVSEVREGRKKSLESVGIEADMQDLSDAIKQDGTTESEAENLLLEMMQDTEGMEPEEIDALPLEERQELRERAEESGSIEDVAEFLAAQLAAEEAGEGVEGEPSREPVPWSAIQEETGVSPEDVTVRAKVQGEEMDLSLEEAVAGYQRSKDYTRKTTELARERDEVREAAERLSQQFDALGLALQQAGVGEQQLQAIEQQYQQARSLQEQYTEEQIREAAEEGIEEVQEEFGWDGTDWEIARARLVTTAEKLGFEPTEYSDITDSRYVKLLEYARRGMEGDSGRKDPPPMKPGQGTRNPATSRKSRASKDVQAARDRLARTGRVDDAADTLLGILAQEGS